MSEPIQSIAQNNYILATQQEVSHDNSLSGNGTVDSPLGVVPGYNETVLYSGDYDVNTKHIAFTEPLSAFSTIKVLWSHQTSAARKWSEFEPYRTFWFENLGRINSDNGQLYTMTAVWRPTDNLMSADYVRGYYAAATTAKAWAINNADINEVIPTKVVGINRIANN